jgi:uncharacterized membrane protein
MSRSSLTPGTSALVLLTSDAVIDTIARAFEGQHMELVRSDLSVQQQDQVQAAFGGPADPRQVPGTPPKRPNGR